MEDYSKQHKKAWEFDAYDFWVRTAGTPEERASKDNENPRKMLKQYANYFDSFEGVKVANICGSCGKKAIPLALLGAERANVPFLPCGPQWELGPEFCSWMLKLHLPSPKTLLLIIITITVREH